MWCSLSFNKFLLPQSFIFIIMFLGFLRVKYNFGRKILCTRPKIAEPHCNLHEGVKVCERYCCSIWCPKSHSSTQIIRVTSKLEYLWRRAWESVWSNLLVPSTCHKRPWREYNPRWTWSFGCFWCTAQSSVLFQRIFFLGGSEEALLVYSVFYV